MDDLVYVPSFEIPDPAPVDVGREDYKPAIKRFHSSCERNVSGRIVVYIHHGMTLRARVDRRNNTG